MATQKPKGPLIGGLLALTALLVFWYLKGNGPFWWVFVGIGSRVALFVAILCGASLVAQVLGHFKLIDLEKLQREYETREKLRREVSRQPKAILAIVIAVITFICPIFVEILLFGHTVPGKPHVWALDPKLIERYEPLIAFLVTLLIGLSIYAGIKWSRNRSALVKSMSAAILSVVVFWGSFLFDRKEANVILVTAALASMLSLTQLPVLYIHTLFHKK